MSDLDSMAEVLLQRFKKGNFSNELMINFMRAVDNAMIENFVAPDNPKDALFELIITRMELLEPHIALMRLIYGSLKSLCLLEHLYTTISTMRKIAGMPFYMEPYISILYVHSMSIFLSTSDINCVMIFLSDPLGGS